MLEIVLALTTVVLATVVWRMWKQIEDLRRENAIVQKRLEAVLEELDQYRAKGKRSFKNIIASLVDLGTPGLVLLVLISTSGWFGAAAITAGLAALGGPFGMLGGIGVLLLLVPTARLIREIGLPKMSQAVIKGLIAKGYSQEDIRGEINKLSKFGARRLQSQIVEMLDSQTEGGEDWLKK
jgi:hypothetical protein